jgi:PAS domain S-box-containing protein
MHVRSEAHRFFHHSSQFDLTPARRVHWLQSMSLSHAQYKSIVESITDLVIILDPDGTIRYANPALRSMLGFSPEELLGSRVQMLLHPDDAECVKQFFSSRIREGYEIGSIAFRVIHKDRSSRWVESLGVNRLADPEVSGVLVVMRDITERKQVEAELRSNERQLEAIVQAVNDIVFEFDEDGQYLNVFAADEAKLARPSKELLGRTIAEVLGAERARPFVDAIRRVLHTGMAERFEYTLAVQDGERHFFTRLHRVPGLDGARDSVCMAISDITDRKKAEASLARSEAQYRNLIEHAPLGIFRAMGDGRLIGANPALISLLGCGGRECLGSVNLIRDVYVDPTQFLHPGSETDEIQWKKPDGSRIWVRVHLRSEWDPISGAEVIGLVEDVTIERNLEAQFLQAQKMEAVGRLAGGVAHDFNNLLTGILSYSDMLIEDLPADDARRADLEQIRRAGTRARELTQQLLAFSRRQVLQVTLLDINEVVRSTQQLLRRVIGEDIAVNIVTTDQPAVVRADPGQIEQIILNLAVNARDAMPAGGLLTLETAHVDLDEKFANRHDGVPPGAYVMLSVSDNGGGIAPEVLEHLFEPFFTTKGPGKGTGLGLASVYGIVKQSGGSIWPYSEPGRGTTFKIFLPRVEGSSSAREEASHSPSHEGGRETILVAEDESGVRDVAARVLSKRGYRLLLAEDGPAALQLARNTSERIELLLSDLVMPGMKGGELARVLRNERPGLRVLFMSGYTDDAVVRQGVLEEGVPYLQKPFSAATLTAKVREVLDGEAR